MAVPKGLKAYQALRKKAKAKGITVPRGTSTEELRALIAGKTTPAKSRRVTQERKRQKANKRKPRKVPRGARTATIKWGW